jgi:hypothetical protein
MNPAIIRVACAGLLIAPQALFAHDRPGAKSAATPPPKDETAAPAIVPPYVLKNRSEFNDPGDSARVPFWPVGWTKHGHVAAPLAVAAPAVTLDERSFHVSSILISVGATPSLAVINGRAYGEGEFLHEPRGSGLRIRVQRIKDGSVILEHDDQILTVPLRRPELNQHKDDPLLDPNR